MLIKWQIKVWEEFRPQNEIRSGGFNAINWKKPAKGKFRVICMSSVQLASIMATAINVWQLRHDFWCQIASSTKIQLTTTDFVISDSMVQVFTWGHCSGTKFSTRNWPEVSTLTLGFVSFQRGIIRCIVTLEVLRIFAIVEIDGLRIRWGDLVIVVQWCYFSSIIRNPPIIGTTVNPSQSEFVLYTRVTM